MDDYLSNINNIDEKMARMRLKNLEILKRHQEIEQDRQQAAVQSSVKMKTTRNRLRPPTNAQFENPHERIHRPPIRRKFENDRSEDETQRVQRIDYNRLKRDRIAQESIANSPKTQLHDYTFHNQSSKSTGQDTDGPSQAKKLVIVNNKADRIGSGRFNQQQRTQDKTQRKREDRMHRSTVPISGTNEYHLDISPIPIWQNGPMHIQLIPTNSPSIDHLINTTSDQIDQTQYVRNFLFPTTNQTATFNSNGTIFFARTPFHQYQPTRTFENSNRHQYHLPTFQTSPIFSPPSLPTPPADNSPNETSVRFRRLKTPEYEKKSRPISTDFERLHNTYQSTTGRFNSNDNRFQSRSQSFYEFSSNNTNSNNIFRLQRTNNSSLPLSAYIDTEHIDNHRLQRRKTAQRPHHHDPKHQFPLSSYDISQYLPNNSSQRQINRNNINSIDEWYEENEIETNSNSTIIDNRSLSTNINLKETPIDNVINSPSNVSTTDSNIIESLDKLQQELKFEEDVDERLASNETTKELTQYDTAHFMQWAKEKFREELAGRLTAQEIEQHDAVTTEDDDNSLNNLDNLEDDLQDKLIIETNQST